MMTPFPFDHLTLKEVAEVEELTAYVRRHGSLPYGKRARFRELMEKRRPPSYDRPIIPPLAPVA